MPKKLHPIVKGYIEFSTNLIELLKNVPEPRKPIIRATLMLREVLSDERPAEEALQVAEAINVKGEDPSLVCLFLAVWIDAVAKIGNVQEAWALLNRYKAIESSQVPIELRVKKYTLEGMLEERRGNKARYAELFKKALASLTPRSPSHDRLVWGQAMFLTRLGRGAEIEAEMNRLDSQWSGDSRGARIALARFFNFVETGHAEEAMQSFPQIEADISLPRFFAESISVYRVAIKLMLGRWKPETAAHANQVPDNLPDVEDWGMATYALLEHRTEEALERARRSAASNPECRKWGYYSYIGFSSLTLIRAELSAGNGEAARRLLRLRQDKGAKQYLDDFFWARVELLAGNREAAARHFAAVLEACEYYKAEPRLDFELRLACELAPGEVMRLTRAAERFQTVDATLSAKEKHPETPPSGTDRLIGKSRAIAKIRETIEQVSPLDVPVLITGETGTGKGLVARIIHETGPRAKTPFLSIDCGAIAESLLQMELFGHEKGAFTGAEKAYKGIFEEAGNGTVFLDGIGEISPQLQADILRLLETGNVRPIGGSKAREIRCRIIVAASAPLEKSVKEGRFCKELPSYVQKYKIEIPPLRRRSPDIVSVAYFFLDEGRSGGKHAQMTHELEEALEKRSWPGNVRELKDSIEQMRLLNSDKLEYKANDLPEEIREPAGRPQMPVKTGGTSENIPSDRPVQEEPTASGHHPIVEAYIRGDGHIYNIVRNTPEPRSPMVNALLYLLEALEGEHPMEEAVKVAQSVSHYDRDPNLTIMFLEIWTEVSCHSDRPREASALVRQMKTLVSEQTPGEFRAMVLLAEGFLASFAGKKDLREEYQKQALALLSPQSFCYKILLWARTFFSAQLGKGVEVREEINWLAENCDKVFTKTLPDITRLAYFVETGCAKEAFPLFSEIELEEDEYILRRFSFILKMYREMVELMLGQWDPEVKKTEKGNETEGEFPWVWSTYYLLEHKPEGALRMVREHARKNPKYYDISVGIFSLAFIRAELASGNGETAKRLIERRRKLGNQHYLDDFFLARAEMLLGNQEKAAGHFTAVQETVKRYKAEARLDFELRLACELSADEIMRLTHLATETPAIGDTKHEEGLKPSVGELRGVDRLLGESPAIAKIRETILQVAPLDVTVLITGETGTGKELIARAIHEAGPRKDEPFMAISCGAITESLLQSELFGHERGAFTGAEREHAGIFEAAGRGTIFLDEIAGISPQLQMVLLRVLETVEIRPVGSAHPKKYFCRVIAATNAPLEKLVDEGRFRKDLLYRLRRLAIGIPPLRERPEDIIPLAAHFLDEGRTGGIQARMEPALEKAFRNHLWLGNVRELRNEIERMRLLNSDKLFYSLADLELETKTDEATPFPAPETVPHAEAAEKSAGLNGNEAVAAMLRGENSPLRRSDRLRDLFRRFKKLTAKETAKILGVSRNTATKYLKKLREEGFIEKVMPNASPQTHYFILRERSSD